MPNRIERITRAREIIARHPGITKRQLQARLKEEFGTGLRDITREQLIKEHLTTRARQVKYFTARPRVFKQPARQKRYETLRDAHFLPQEAREFSKLRSLNYHEMKLMMAERRVLWDKFTRKVIKEDWGQARGEREWRQSIRDWYIRHGYVTEKTRKLRRAKRKPNPWDWFNKTSGKLPPEMQAESPRRHKGKRQDFVTVDKIIISREIQEMEKRRQATDIPSEKRRLGQMIKILKGSLK